MLNKMAKGRERFKWNQEREGANFFRGKNVTEKNAVLWGMGILSHHLLRNLIKGDKKRERRPFTGKGKRSFNRSRRGTKRD